MERTGMQRKYYEPQSGINWDRQQVEFEAKIEELRSVKTELLSQKQAMLSPKRANLVQSKTFEEMQALLVLKEEENDALGRLLTGEKVKNKDLLIELQRFKNENSDLDGSLKKCKQKLMDMEKNMSRYFNSMTVLKTNVNNWLGSGTSKPKQRKVSELSSPKYDSELSTHKSEIQELKSKLGQLQESYQKTLSDLSAAKKAEMNEDKLVNYLMSNRNSLPADEGFEQQLEQKNKELQYMQEELKSREEAFQDLLSQNSRQKNMILELEAKAKNQTLNLKAHSYTNSVNYEYENNLKILTENSQLLQERVRALELEKIQIFQDLKKEKLFTAKEFARIIISSYSTHDDQRKFIEENLCKLWMTHENIFSNMLHTMFGKDYGGLFQTMQKKIETLQKEVTRKTSEYTPEPGTAEKRKNFKENQRLKKFSNSLSQGNMKFLFQRGSPSISSARKDQDDEVQSVLVLENLVTDNTEPDRLPKTPQNPVSTADIISFLQCSASALEDCLG